MNVLISTLPTLSKDAYVTVLVREIITRNGIAKYTSKEMDLEYTKSYSILKTNLAESLKDLIREYAATECSYPHEVYVL